MFGSNRDIQSIVPNAPFDAKAGVKHDRDTPATQEPISFPLHRRSPGIRLDVLSSGDVLMISPMWIHRIHRPHTDYGSRNHRNAVAMPAARRTFVCNANNTPHYLLRQLKQEEQQ
ncbi:uncharacterized protein PAC_19488 [Phialocephala subalpina]|uniref:Uncharacterized protein n=1 Tax=Phialocephala subalpina TaxID=576137 RepID=A0A1L7XX56_9HELO|nr:uncharacterized protein PAC_19488 [Phialocephala subalpina]